MWECENMDERQLGDIAFSEEFSFCISSPLYDEDKVFHKSLITSKSSPYLGEDLNNKKRRKSSPIIFNDISEYSANSPNFLNPRKAYFRRRTYLGTQEIYVTLMKRDGSLGFTIAVFIGGIFIKTLTKKHTVSDGKIRPGDRILQVNGRDISSLSSSEVVIYLRNVPGNVTLKICRSCSVWSFCPKHSLPKVQTFNVICDKLPNKELGISVCHSSKGSDIRNYLLPSVVEIETVYNGSIADENGIKVGDRVLEVNIESLLGKTADEATDIIQKTNGIMKIVFCRML